MVTTGEINLLRKIKAVIFTIPFVFIFVASTEAAEPVSMINLRSELLIIITQGFTYDGQF